MTVAREGQQLNYHQWTKHRYSQKPETLTDNRIKVVILILNRNIEEILFEKADSCVKLDFDTWFLYGYYTSQNILLPDYKHYVNSVICNIREYIRRRSQHLNAITWGSPFTNEPRNYNDDWTSKLNLTIINTRN